MKLLLRCFLLLSSCLLIFSSCRKNVFDNSPSAKLLFSADTIAFDTVFTSIGSASLIFKVYNHDCKNINISSIRLANGANSFFRLNVNGVPGSTFSNVEVYGKDSMYIYVAVTINPNNANNPFLVLDSILFTVNGNQQQVLLSAYGQNAYFHYGEILKKDSIWLNDKPHVIINSFYVDTTGMLTIKPGTRIYMHANSTFYVFGTLVANGTLQDSIVFQGDRLEDYYVGLPGNWPGILFTPSSKDNSLTHCIITDGTDGVTIDSLSVDSKPKLTMQECMIRNMYDDGIQSVNGSVLAINCVVYNCVTYCAFLIYGGNNNFEFCTFADYGNIAINHEQPSVAFANYYPEGNSYLAQTLTVTNDTFTNCIIYGGLNNELLIDSIPSINSTIGAKPLHYQFTNCNIQCTQQSFNGFSTFLDCQQNMDPLFNNYPNGDLTVSQSPTRSPCIDSGITISGITLDYNNVTRNTPKPTIGCYEK